MNKEEFEAGINTAVTMDVFDRVNFVYMNSDFFTNKEQVYNFWKLYDLNGFERLHKDILKIKNLESLVCEARIELTKMRKLTAIARQLLEDIVEDAEAIA